MQLFTPEFYAISEPILSLNFGEIIISKEGVQLLLKDNFGQTLLQKDFSFQDLQFDESLLNKSKLCLAKCSKQQVFTQITHWVDYLVKGDLHMIFTLLIFF